MPTCAMGDGAAGGFLEGFGIFSADLFMPISVVGAATEGGSLFVAGPTKYANRRRKRGAATEGGSLFVAGVVDGGVVACVDRGGMSAAVSGPIFE